ncbi:MAG: hypothetical protein JST00_39775 [Deltaproteobacteria bacterium]|nr:hypothetical protein [Deltaproteobacteria bacterium]
MAYAPVLVAFWANFVFIRNHFYVHGPYLHDSGWFSALVWRNGLMPRSPASVAWEVVYYWGWHPSLLLSAGSALSYVFPGDRVEWYSIFQGAIYAPVAVAFPLLVDEERRNDLVSAVVAAVCSLTLLFSGQVVSCSFYPHFEIFSSAGIVIMLAALAMGRERLAWLGIAMSVATREDGGFHSSTFLAAVLAADLTGHAFPVPRRRVFLMLVGAFAGTVVLVIVQKKFFVSPEAWKHYLSGDPPYAHVNGAFLAARLRGFVVKCSFIWAPCGVAALAALARRDWRYVLGWLVGIPWLVLNLTALQDIKGELAVYTGFPFVGSIFWVAAYARAGDRGSARIGWRWAMNAGAVAGLASLLGLDWTHAPAVESFFENAAFPLDRNPEGIRALANDLRERRLGAVHTDPAMASWGIEQASLPDLVTAADLEKAKWQGEGFALWAMPESIALLVQSPFTVCGRVPRTRAIYCTLPGRPLPSSVVPTSPLLASCQIFGEHARWEGEAITVDAAPFGGSTIGPFIKLPPGAYRATWQIDLLGCQPGVVAHVDILRGARTLVGMGDAPAGGDGAVLDFVVTPDTRDEPWEFRTFTAPCPYVIHGIDVRRTDRAPR